MRPAASAFWFGQERELPDLAQQYAELKTELAERHGDDQEAYTRAKTDFVQQVLSE